jgi:hypothetical protein
LASSRSSHEHYTADWQANKCRLPSTAQISPRVGRFQRDGLDVPKPETKTTALTTNQKVHGIVHTAATAAAAVGAGLAQLPGSDAPVLAGIQTTMIIAVAHEHGARSPRPPPPTSC